MLAEGLNNLLNMLSIRVPLFVENRVGNVICGFRLCDITKLRNSPYSILSFTLRRLILKSPAGYSGYSHLVNRVVFSCNNGPRTFNRPRP